MERLEPHQSIPKQPGSEILPGPWMPNQVSPMAEVQRTETLDPDILDAASRRIGPKETFAFHSGY